MEYLNGDWKEEAFSDEREVPYKAIMCIMIMGSQFVTCLIGSAYNTHEAGI